MKERRPTLLFWTTAAVFGALAATAAYAVSYWLLVTPERGNDPGPFCPRYGKHRSLDEPTPTEDALQILFLPANWIDREFIRPDKWDDDLLDRLYRRAHKPDATPESN